MTRQSLSLIYCFCEGGGSEASVVCALSRAFCCLLAFWRLLVSKRAASPRVGVISRVGDSFLICHPSNPTHNSTSEFRQLTSSPSCCRALTTSFRPPPPIPPFPQPSCYLLASLPSPRTPSPQAACLPASGGSSARGG